MASLTKQEFRVWREKLEACREVALWAHSSPWREFPYLISELRAMLARLPKPKEDDGRQMADPTPLPPIQEPMPCETVWR